MMRARPGTPAPKGRVSRAPRKEANVLRNVPPTSVRKGVNGQKSEQASRARVRAKRSGTIRRAFSVFRVATAALLVTAALTGAGWAGWHAYQTHDLLALREIDVVGNNLVAKSAILEKAGLELGSKLPMIRTGLVESALRDLPGVGEVEVKRMYPSRIEIRIRESEPVAMGFARGWYGLAPDGARIAGLDWGRSDLPVVDGFNALDSNARAALGAFLDGARKDYPSLYANFSQLAFHAPDGVEIILRDRRLKVLIALDRFAPAGKSATQGSNKSLISLEFLQALQQQQAASLEPGRTVDLRVEGFAYVH